MRFRTANDSPIDTTSMATVLKRRRRSGRHNQSSCAAPNPPDRTTAGIAAIMSGSQLGKLTGIAVDADSFFTAIDYVVRHLDDTHVPILVLAPTACATRRPPPLFSPLLGNVYLHHVLDRWFEEEIAPCLVGSARLVRYADDFVCVVHGTREHAAALRADARKTRRRRAG